MTGSNAAIARRGESEAVLRKRHICALPGLAFTPHLVSLRGVATTLHAFANYWPSYWRVNPLLCISFSFLAFILVSSPPHSEVWAAGRNMMRQAYFILGCLSLGFTLIKKRIGRVPPSRRNEKSRLWRRHTEVYIWGWKRRFMGGLSRCWIWWNDKRYECLSTPPATESDTLLHCPVGKAPARSTTSENDIEAAAPSRNGGYKPLSTGDPDTDVSTISSFA